MKEVKICGDKYDRWYEISDKYGYSKKFGDYQSLINYYNYESEEEISRLAREKAIKRNKIIDSILD